MNEHDFNTEPPELPAALREAFNVLGGLDVKPFDIPPSVDSAVLSSARPVLADIRRARRTRQRATWAVLATAAALALWFVLTPVNAPRLDRNARMDIDGNGVVDVLDAFALARKLRAHESLPAAGDFNQDGAVDDADVELVMAKAVDLSNVRPR